jgi:hypothetical protein
MIPRPAIFASGTLQVSFFARLFWSSARLPYFASCISLPCEKPDSRRGGRWKRLPDTQYLLFAEDLHHGLILGLVHLGQGLGYQRLVLEAAAVQHFVQPERRVAKQNLRVLEALIVI